MHLRRRPFLIGAVGVTGLAGCLGADAEMEDPTVAVADHAEFGQILVDEEGLTLYMFDSDERGADESTCEDECAENWPPLVVGMDAQPIPDPAVIAALSTFERPDGHFQVAANGWPLYYWDGDADPGEANGQGINDEWWVISPEGEPIREADE